MTESMRTLINSGYRYAMSLCANTADSEDLVQEAWTRLTSRGGVRDRAQLFTTIKRIYIDQYRRSRVVQFVPLANEPETRAMETRRADQPGHMLGDTLLLEQALQSLRQEEREAMFLSVVEGYTAQEISEMLDKPRNTILSHIHRAKARLAELLADASDEYTTPRAQ